MHNKLTKTTKTGEFSALGFNYQDYGWWHARKTFTIGHLTVFSGWRNSRILLIAVSGIETSCFAFQKKSGRMEKKKKRKILWTSSEASASESIICIPKKVRPDGEEKKRKILWTSSEASASGSYKCHNVERDHNVALLQCVSCTANRERLVNYLPYCNQK